MKQLNKGQMRIIIALNLAVVALLCGLFFKYPLGEAPVSGTPKEEIHELNRNARVSLSIDLDLETNIGGSKNEELIACFASPDQANIHIFGNTESDDYDFKDKKGDIFYVVLNKKGKIEKLFTYGNEGDILRKVIIAEGGYLLAVDSTSDKSTHLLHISYDGTLSRKMQHGVVSEETVADLILTESCYMLIVHSGIAALDFYDIKVFFYGLDFSDNGVSVLHNASYSQEYVAVLPKGLDKFIMAVNFKSELWNGMSIVEFSKSTNFHTKIQLENNYEAKSLMPFSGGYAALVIDNLGRSSLITLSSSDYSLKEKKYLATYATDAKLFFANSKYYAYSANEDITSVTVFDSSLSNGEDMALFRQAGKIENSYIRDSGAIFACSGEKASVIGLSGTQNYFKKFGSSGKEMATRLVFLSNSIYLVCESDAKGDDIGGNFGKKDIWLAKLSD